jgi:hypothetical protein
MLATGQVCKVLRALLRDQISPEQVQLWAFFVSRGYLGHWESRPATEPVEPVETIDIDWDPTTEDRIAEVLLRLDDIDTKLVGEITKSEIENMLRNLSESSDA